MGAMNKMTAKKSKYDIVFKLPMPFDKVIDTLIKTPPRRKTSKRG